ncbi:MAG: sarcosine oxidase subunit gamma [Alphaproteobacteria bacterium]
MHKRPPSYRFNSPLQMMAIAANAHGYSKGDTWIGERITAEGRHLGIVNLRADASNEALMAAISKAIGVTPSTEPCSVAVGDKVSAIWLSVDEWLLVSDTQIGAKTVEDLNAATQGMFLSVVNLTSNYATIRLSGSDANGVLSKLVPYDTHADNFKVGSAIGTVAGKANVVLHKLDEEPTYDVYVRRSFACYVWQYLQDAGLEYDLKVAGRI